MRRQNANQQAEAGVKSGSRALEAMYETQRVSPSSGARQASSTASLIANGKSLAGTLYARSEALGLNQAVLSTLSELRVCTL